MSEKHVVDSSAWLEYFADGPNADYFAPVIEVVDALVVPVVTIYEVYKRVFLQRDESDALRAVALMQQGSVVHLDESISLEAAMLSITHQLPMADSMILATARRYKATLWTQDSDFREMEGVNYQPARDH
ncbi:type II toxin-antitoxin system VapC family toxin [Algiphilus sp.]|uniref:type II toxin-antitoxin system VapC family toxin n=1 Tax=Algiphilus sp. TaxID=1872431 RepID=UPI003B517C69